MIIVIWFADNSFTREDKTNSSHPLLLLLFNNLIVRVIHPIIDLWNNDIKNEVTIIKKDEILLIFDCPQLMK